MGRGRDKLQLRCARVCEEPDGAGGGAISYGYDANGQRTSLRYPDGAKLSDAYWPDG